MQFFLIPFILALAVNAANDWKIPCINGRCAHDFETSSSGTGGSILLVSLYSCCATTFRLLCPTKTRTSSAISDITEAAGWKILNCSPDAIAQDIRIVCKDEAAGSCSHLYTDGAIDTLVRLPQTVRLDFKYVHRIKIKLSKCGKMAFARLAREWDHEDQSLPNSSFIVRRSGSQPVVKGMSLDTNFAAIDPSM
jgi:hypothetical protein